MASNPTHRRARPHPAPLFDVPSYLFLTAVVVNTVLISQALQPILLALLALSQAFLLVGCQEAKHQCVHGSFVSNGRLNDALGILCAALFGVNFVAYRYFHFRHHRATCTDEDPEGKLYAVSWRTRWIWILAPIELPWVAWHINRVGCPMVPSGQRGLWLAAFVGMVAFAVALSAAAWCAPHTVVWGYLVPIAIFTWFDFLLTQAEHYDAPIIPAPSQRPSGTITLDITLPLGLGWLTLHRSLHAIHHRYPGMRWFEAPRRLRADPAAEPISYFAFVRRWLVAGPRLWTPANAGPQPAAPHGNDTSSQT
ncbi:fatty acid desaturase family protein [Burkholderia lata]|uniref:fatty acid desaturase family protein n=1 Tax=Burkholderia lata (strain ATCC 17760 / DSM 23089 / LMG 22485 / NCIMB 9086 / R18194 / 383) TaxID=482957 RepID=UPI001452E8C6|nr:fatty acid desaturase [Burkholderia lata]VWB89062.1 fatty acid desaturase [Burkholderia lata]